MQIPQKISRGLYVRRKHAAGHTRLYRAANFEGRAAPDDIRRNLAWKFTQGRRRPALGGISAWLAERLWLFPRARILPAERRHTIRRTEFRCVFRSEGSHHHR